MVKALKALKALRAVERGTGQRADQADFQLESEATGIDR